MPAGEGGFEWIGITHSFIVKLTFPCCRLIMGSTSHFVLTNCTDTPVIISRGPRIEMTPTSSGTGLGLTGTN